MAIRLSMILTANGRQALAEMSNLRGSFEATAGAGYRIGDAADITGAKLGQLSSKVNLATTQFTEFKAAQIQAALASAKLNNANGLAAGSVGNLAAQFNDIGVMLAAGQNPLQLALQQGTQITQVIGPLGTTGAVRALSTAFVSLINPVSLITIGTIAAGAALFQYARGALSATEETSQLADAIAKLEERAVTAEDKLALLRSGLGSLEELRVQQEINRLRQQQAEAEAQMERLSGRNAGAARQRMLAYKAQADELERIQQSGKEREASLAREEQLQRKIITAQRIYAQTRLQSDAAIEDNLRRQHQLFGETRAEADALSQQLLEAYRTGGDFSGVDLEAGVDAAAAAAAALAENLGVSLNVARGMVALGTSLAAPGGSDQARNNVRDEFSGIGGLREGDIISRTTLSPQKNTSAATAAKRQQQALRDLIQGMRDELAILRETDPVQREMIRNREALTGASEAQRTTVEGLIREHQAETDALERKQSAWDLVGNSATSVLDGIFDKSKSLGDVLRNLASSILQVAIQGQLLGTGPFGNGSGGLIGSIFPALVPGLAEGGPVRGPGGPKDDKVLLWGSNGEFMMNAAATQRYRPILEMMNAGAPIGGFAQGGAIGGSTTRLASAANGNRAPLNVNIDLTGARGDREIEEASYRGMQRALEEYDRESLPQRVTQIQNNPRMVG